MNQDELKEYFKNDRFAALTGAEIIEASKGYCKAKLEVKNKHLNAANTIQGGALFTLADFAFAVASNSHGQLALAVNVNISFLQGVSKGTIYATATEVTNPKRIGAYDVLITTEDNVVLARFNGLVYRKNQSLTEQKTLL